MTLQAVTQHNFAQARPDIVRAVAEAQIESARSLGIDSNEMYLQPYCQNVTPKAQRRIQALGWAAMTDARAIPTFIYHEYLRFPGSGLDGDEIIADGTWGQFLPDGRASGYEPRVLVGARSTLIQSAIRYGVPSTHPVVQCWLPTTAFGSARRLDDRASIFDIQYLRAIMDI